MTKLSKQRQLKSADYWVSRKVSTPGAKPPRASLYVHHLEELVKEKPRLEVVLVCRVSGREQHRRKHLRDQRASLRRNVEALGARVVREFSAVASGWDDDWLVVESAAAWARRHGAVLMAESTCRYLRNREYSSTECPWVLPTRDEWEKFLAITRGVKLATLLHPDAHWKDVRSYQSKRGMIEKESKRGRPRKRRPGELSERREALLPEVIKLRCKWLVSYRNIGAALNVPWRTVKDWLRPYESSVCGFFSEAYLRRLDRQSGDRQN